MGEVGGGSISLVGIGKSEVAHIGTDDNPRNRL
jgi:hypothetical protein